MNRKSCKDEDSSTESNDDAKPHHFSNIAAEQTCTHVKAAVCQNAIRKKLKQSKLEKECKKCLTCSTPKINNPALDCDAEADGIQVEPYDLWMCLKCGSQLCGRPQLKHALEHASADRSDSHAMVVSTKTFQVWCYECDNEINAKLTPRLAECVDMVRRVADKREEMPQILNIEQKFRTTAENLRAVMCDELPTPIASGSTITNTTMGVGDRGGAGTITQARLTNSCNSIASVSVQHKIPTYRDIRLDAGGFKQPVPTVSTVVDNLPRVRGLSNLGNTCFFNAVLQCLARTPFLLEVLQETQMAGEKFQLPGGPLTLNDGTETELRPISGELSAWGNLTQAFAETLMQLQSGGPGVFSPSKLLRLLTNKCPQFAGADQHDSHELLRQLLENVRSEDLKRYHLVILTSVGLRKSTEPNSVDSILKQKVKFYGMQAADRILCPEPVFRGFLVSTLTCQDCGHTSSRHEYFLDLSLPVTAEKPQPPIRRKGSPEPDYGYSAVAKPMSSKERRRVKKANKSAAKREKTWLNSNQAQPNEAEPHITGAAGAMASNVAGESGGGDADSGGDDDDNMSDADVEDNLTDDSQPKKSGIDQNGNQACGGASVAALIGPEKCDDTPENPNKEGVGDGNVVCELGLSADGIANMMQKITINSSDQQEDQMVKKIVKTRRHRTYSHADWGSTLAPRYHCEDNECSIQSCFNAFTAMELMTGNNKVCCDACTERINGKDAKKSINTNATKQFLVSSPPAVLILHLKRFQVGPRGILRKITRAVTFPCLLDIAPFCGSKVKTLPNVKRDQKKLLYSLYGIVEHSGTMHGGHYVAYVKVRPLISKDDPRWNFLPKGTKAELDQEDEQTLLLERELALEKARQMTSNMTATARDSDDALTSSSSSGGSSSTSSRSSTGTGASDAEAEEGAVGYTPKPEALPNVDPPPGRWYYVSDSHVLETTEEKVLNAQAYLLFYERIF